jgi:serine/threonine protein kinase
MNIEFNISDLEQELAGDYDNLSLIGKGGMANVYSAREIGLDRVVALKVLPPIHYRDKEYVERFEREARTAGRLQHPNIVQIHRISRSEKLVFFSMGILRGGDLKDMLRDKGAISGQRFHEVMTDVCSALQYAHDEGVIHRDLKPDNVMLDEQGRAVVMDFGIAKARQAGGLTQVGVTLGTPHYMSPEQARGLELDRRSDIYSLGVLMYQLSTGKLPFRHTDPSALIHSHVYDIPQEPCEINNTVPAWLNSVILKCLLKDPRDRIQQASEIVDVLRSKKNVELPEDRGAANIASQVSEERETTDVEMETTRVEVSAGFDPSSMTIVQLKEHTKDWTSEHPDFKLLRSDSRNGVQLLAGTIAIRLKEEQSNSGNVNDDAAADPGNILPSGETQSDTDRRPVVWLVVALIGVGLWMIFSSEDEKLLAVQKYPQKGSNPRSEVSSDEQAVKREQSKSASGVFPNFKCGYLQGTYEGTLQDRRNPNGNGTFYNAQWKFEGMWDGFKMSGKMSGHSGKTYVNATGSFLDCELLHGKAKVGELGKVGEFTFRGGRRGVKVLTGTMRREGSETFYQGEFMDWVPHGKGKLAIAGGGFFEGVFQNGEFVNDGSRPSGIYVRDYLK